MKYKMEVLGAAICCLLLIIPFLTAMDQDKMKRYAIIVKSEDNMYNQELIEGFSSVIKVHGGSPIVRSPKIANVVEQINIINSLISEKVDCIAVASNDEDALQHVLTNAMDEDIAVLSFDAAVNAECRILHVDTADAQQVARMLMDEAEVAAGGKGDIAILSTTPQSHNQNQWIYWMRHYLEDGQYEQLRLVDIVFGDDDYTKSVKKVNALIKDYPEIKVIIAPTAIGIVAASEAVTAKELEDSIKVTGLGLPSEMSAYIGSDRVAPAVFLWNPYEVGMLTAYASLALADGEVSGQAGEKVVTDELGDFIIVNDGYNGTVITLQTDPVRFDESNIDDWKDKY